MWVCVADGSTALRRIQRGSSAERPAKARLVGRYSKFGCGLLCLYEAEDA